MIIDIETTGLNPVDDKIVCIGIVDKNNNTIDLSERGLDDEKQILEEFFNIAKDEKNLIGFNIKSFDIPFILKRALINDVIVCENFNGLNIKDCRKIANGFWYSYNKRAKGKLSDWAKIMGFEVETHNGGHVPKLYEEGKINEIVNHCIEDLKITRELWNRIKKCNLD